MTFDHQSAIEHFIIRHGGRVSRPTRSIDNPFGTEEALFSTPDGTIRPISEFSPNLFRNDTVDISSTRVRGERIVADDIADSFWTAGVIIDDPIRRTNPTRRHQAPQVRRLTSGIVSPVFGNSTQARNRNIYKLRGILQSIIPLIPSDIYSDEFTQADVQSLINTVSSALDSKRKHDYICEPCLKSINNGKSAKSTAHNHSGKACYKCESIGPTVFRIHKDRLARLEAQSQS